ncbi:MAG: glycosyltransferase family 39 protein [Pseudomonadota bacterium]
MSSAIDDRGLSRTGWLAGCLLILLASLFLQLKTARETVLEASGVRGDAREYLTYAVNLRQHGIYSRKIAAPGAVPTPDAVRAPGYPFLLALLIEPDARDLGLSRIVLLQALLGTATILLCLLLFRRFLPPAWALAAAGLAATSPHLVNAGVYLLTESVFTFLLVLHLFCLERGWSLRSGRWLLAAGIVLAVSIMVRPTTQYLVLFYGLALLLLRDTAWQQRLKALACLLVPILVLSGAWGWRNVQATGHFSDPLLQADFLHHGMYVDMKYNDDPRTYGYPYRFNPEAHEYHRNTGRVIREIADRFAEEPLRHAGWYLIGKPVQLLSWHLTESIGGPFVYAPAHSPWLESSPLRIINAITRGMHAPLMLLAFAGASLVIWRLAAVNPGVAVSAIVFFYFLAVHMLGAPFPRYSVPLRPLCYALALWLLHEGWQAWRRHRNGETP